MHLWFSICIFNIPALKKKYLIHLIPFKWQFSFHSRHSTITCGVIPLWRRLHRQATYSSHSTQKGAENRVLLCPPHSQPGNRRNKSYSVSTKRVQPRGLWAKGTAFIFQLVGNLMLAKYLLGVMEHCLGIHCWNSQVLCMVGFVVLFFTAQLLDFWKSFQEVQLKLFLTFFLLLVGDNLFWPSTEVFSQSIQD